MCSDNFYKKNDAKVFGISKKCCNFASANGNNPGVVKTDVATA